MWRGAVCVCPYLTLLTPQPPRRRRRRQSPWWPCLRESGNVPRPSSASACSAPRQALTALPVTPRLVLSHLRATLARLLHPAWHSAGPRLCPWPPLCPLQPPQCRRDPSTPGHQGLRGGHRQCCRGRCVWGRQDWPNLIMWQKEPVTELLRASVSPFVPQR